MMTLAKKWDGWIKLSGSTGSPQAGTAKDTNQYGVRTDCAHPVRGRGTLRALAASHGTQRAVKV